MDAVEVILGCVALAGVGASVWLAIRLARATALASGVRAGAERTEADLAATRVKLAEREAKAERAEAAAASLTTRIAELEKDLDAAERHHQLELKRVQEVTQEQVAAGEARERAFREQIGRDREQMEGRLRDMFRALSAETLSATTQEFLRLAGEKFSAHAQAGAADLDQRRKAVEDMVAPIRETLAKTDQKLVAIERTWAEDKGKLSAELKNLGEAGQTLRAETSKLVKALREPQVRGRYGEVQLRRVAELAGMRSYCDFSEQHTTTDADGRLLRPDMIVRLPSGREIAVDSKANLKPYLDAVDAPDPGQADAALDSFADGVARQAALLAKKGYWSQYEGSPDFVVMFLPGDQFVDAALSRRPDLLDAAASRGVLLASPSTLIGLLRAVHVGFQEQRLAEQAQELRRLGAELHHRAATAMDHAARLGQSLAGAIESYNDFVGSYERRLRPTLEKFEEAGAKSAKDLPPIQQIDAKPRLPDGQPLLLPER